MVGMLAVMIVQVVGLSGHIGYKAAIAALDNSSCVNGAMVAMMEKIGKGRKDEKE